MNGLGPVLRGDRKLAIHLCWILIWLLAPAWLRAQTIELGGSPMDAWRARMSERVDEDLAKLVATAQSEPPSAWVAKENRDDVPATQPVLSLRLATDRKEPWLPQVAAILREQGLPTALMGVAAVESGFDPEVLSPKGALGLWQLMPQTARRFGLEVSARRDDRLDPVKSTYAAASYLKDLYALFGDWPLALAAYNAGEDRVQQALDRHGARDFWALSRRSALPEETRRYVPAVLAEMNRTMAVPSFIPRDSRHAGLQPVSQAVRKASAPATIVFAVAQTARTPFAGSLR